MPKSLTIINRKHTSPVMWYSITIPSSELRKIKDRVLISMLMPDTIHALALNIYGDYYAYCYYSLYRNVDCVHVLRSDDYASIRYEGRTSSFAATSSDLETRIGGCIFVTPQCGCSSLCSKSIDGYLYGVIDVYRDKVYCVRFDLYPLRCAMNDDECIACYLFNSLKGYLLSHRRSDNYSTVVESFLSEHVCRISGAQLLKCVGEDEFKSIIKLMEE
jgi:hypothetical protein